MKVKTSEVQLNAYSIQGYVLPTFSKGRLKTVYNRWGCVVAKYIVFKEITHVELLGRLPKNLLTTEWQYRPIMEENPIYKTNYIRVK